MYIFPGHVWTGLALNSGRSSADIQLGDKIKWINGSPCKGQTKAFVHGVVRSAGTDGTINLWLVKVPRPSPAVSPCTLTLVALS